MDGRKEEIFNKALDEFLKLTDFKVIPQGEAKHEPGHPDAMIRVFYEERHLDFAVVVKLIVTRATIGSIKTELRKMKEIGLLVTRYVTPQIAELLREMDIPFIDTAANAYINEPPLYVFIKGNKPADERHLKPIQRVFRPAGLKVLFTLLCHPGMEAKPLREIAAAADVALGTVNGVMKELARMGYLVDMGRRGRRLVKKENLLKRWVTAYPEQLKPKQFKGRFRATAFEWWKKVAIKDFGAYWGGEIAAALLTQYLKPEITTIYTRQPMGKLVIKNNLKKDPDGNIEILTVFWNFENDNDLVPPILVYADLLATGDNRNIETAEKVYDAEIARFIRED